MDKVTPVPRPAAPAPKAPAPPPPPPPRPATRPEGVRKKSEESAVRKPPETKKVEAKKETGTRAADEKAFAKRGRERLNRGDIDGAIADYSRAIEINPEFAEAYANRGVARERKGDLAGAKADYAKSIEIQIRDEIARQFKSQEDPEP